MFYLRSIFRGPTYRLYGCAASGPGEPSRRSIVVVVDREPELQYTYTHTHIHTHILYIHLYIIYTHIYSYIYIYNVVVCVLYDDDDQQRVLTTAGGALMRESSHDLRSSASSPETLNCVCVRVCVNVYMRFSVFVSTRVEKVEKYLFFFFFCINDLSRTMSYFIFIFLFSYIYSVGQHHNNNKSKQSIHAIYERRIQRLIFRRNRSYIGGVYSGGKFFPGAF